MFKNLIVEISRLVQLTGSKFTRCNRAISFV